jgi:hypothetical protein
LWCDETEEAKLAGDPLLLEKGDSEGFEKAGCRLGVPNWKIHLVFFPRPRKDPGAGSFDKGRRVRYWACRLIGV